MSFHICQRGGVCTRETAVQACAPGGERATPIARGAGLLNNYSSLKGVVWGVGDLHTAQNRDAKKVSE